MEAITYNNLAARLIEAIPELPADTLDVKQNLNYIVFSDLTRFITSLLEAENNHELLQRIFNFIEIAATTQDRQIIDVVRDSFNELAMKEPDRAKSYMGRFTRKILGVTQLRQHSVKTNYERPKV